MTGASQRVRAIVCQIETIAKHAADPVTEFDHAELARISRAMTVAADEVSSRIAWDEAFAKQVSDMGAA